RGEATLVTVVHALELALVTHGVLGGALLVTGGAHLVTLGRHGMALGGAHLLARLVMVLAGGLALYARLAAVGSVTVSAPVAGGCRSGKQDEAQKKRLRSEERRVGK